LEYCTFKIYFQSVLPRYNNNYYGIQLFTFIEHVSLGHYVVLLGFNHSKRLIIYNDPNSNFEQCKISYDFFEKARKSCGTDQDLILVNELLATN